MSRTRERRAPVCYNLRERVGLQLVGTGPVISRIT
jgi:hypothetical protein